MNIAKFKKKPVLGILRGIGIDCIYNFGRKNNLIPSLLGYP